MKLWNKLYLKQKILLVFLPLSILSILVILIVSVTVIVKDSKREIIQNTLDKLTLVADQTDRILSNAKYNIKAFSTSSSLQDAIRTDYSADIYGDYLFSTSMHSSVYNIMDIGSLIQNGYIHTYDNKIFDIKTDDVSLHPDAKMMEDYSKIIEKGGQIIISKPKDSSGKSAFHLSKSLIDIKNGNCLGVLSFDIKEELFYNSYRHLSTEGEEQFLIVSDDGTVISAENRSLLQQKVLPSIFALMPGNSLSKTLSIDGKKLLVLSLPITESNCYVVCLVPYFTIIEEAVRFAKILVIIGILVLFATIFLSKIFADSLIKPLSQLTALTDAVGDGSLDFSVSVVSHDEIGILSLRFHEMLENIKHLTQSIYEEQNQKREYELRLLQSQINPHFLYNCLDNITTLIEEKENNVAAHMVRHLGVYYRAILSKGRNIITIKEELQLIRDYLEIQLLKSPGSFTYQISCQEGLGDYKILKMLLQPIVENSVIHGFSGFAVEGAISITASSKENDVFLTLTDNGRGMDETILSQVFSPSSTSVPMHFGLKNIQDRIALKFGAEYGISIQATPGAGTIIEVHFPKLL